MKRFAVLMLLFVLGALLFGGTVNLGPAKSLKQFNLENTSESLGTGTYRLNPFIFSMAFCERLADGLGLYKIISYQDLVKTGVAIFDRLNHGGGATLTISDFKDGKDLVLRFYYLDQEKLKLKYKSIMCLSNYNESTSSIIDTEEGMKDAWCMMYQIAGTKLVEYKFLKGTAKKPVPGSKIDLANYYLQDADAANDSKIEGLILSGLKTDKNPYYPMAYAILAQYYIMQAEFDKAKSAMARILIAKNLGKGLTNEELYYITYMEMDLCKAAR